jgi:hypothetical protein
MQSTCNKGLTTNRIIGFVSGLLGSLVILKEGMMLWSTRGRGLSLKRGRPEVWVKRARRYVAPVLILVVKTEH